MATHANMNGAARADELPIEPARDGLEWGLIGLLVGLAGGGGATRLRRKNLTPLSEGDSA